MHKEEVKQTLNYQSVPKIKQLNKLDSIPN